MALFNQFKRGVDVTKFKADQLMRVNRVQGEIMEIRRKIVTMHSQIANATIELHKNGALANPELVELCVATAAFDKQIAEKEQQIVAIRAEQLPVSPQPSTQSRPVNPCPKCNYDVPIGAVFCGNCGAAISQPSSQAEINPAPLETNCPNCNSPIPAGSAFCPTCGLKIQP